jgi:serine/threonine protein phosphatase 1
MGSMETLASYGLQPGWTTTRGKLARQIADLVPPEHLEFLRNLPVRHKVGPYFFVHAGIDPDRSLDDQDEEDMLWIRAPFLNDRRDHGKLIVHGHTPVPEVVHAGNRVNIDTGAGFGRPLSAVALEGREVFVLTERGRVRVSPLADA